MALAVFSAVAVLDAGSPAAAAAPSRSEFAGTYVGADPANYRPSWTVTISDAGRISSSYSATGGSKGSISGQVDADGSYSLTVSVTYAGLHKNGRDPREPRWTITYTSAGTMTSDAGNIVGTDDTGRTFTWLRQ